MSTRVLGRLVAAAAPTWDPAKLDTAADIIVPAQWAGRHGPNRAAADPHRNLALAVLMQALHDLHTARRGIGWTGAFRPRLAEVTAWFADDDGGDWPFRFRPLCEALGLDAAAIRARVLGGDVHGA